MITVAYVGDKVAVMDDVQKAWEAKVEGVREVATLHLAMAVDSWGGAVGEKEKVEEEKAGVKVELEKEERSRDRGGVAGGCGEGGGGQGGGEKSRVGTELLVGVVVGLQREVVLVEERQLKNRRGRERRKRRG